MNLYLPIKKSEIHNFGEDNTIASVEDTIKDWIEKLKTGSKKLYIG